MSVTATARSMRVVAIPLALSTRERRPIKAPYNQDTSTYYHFQITSPKTQKSSDGVVNWLTGRAAAVWASFGKAPEGSWKLRTFRYGEWLVDRIDFEEFALKSVDPSLGPSLDEPTAEKTTVVPLVYPPSIRTAPASLSHLRGQLLSSTPRHRTGFITWMAIAPLTFPLIVIPLIPNLPLFFCVWRSWSHWRAYRGSRYLERLVEKGAIVPEESKELDSIYKEYASETVLPRAAVERIVKEMGLSETASGEMHRAIEQTRTKLE